MRLQVSIALVLTALYAQAAERKPEFAAGRDYYQAAEFQKAAASFQVLCNVNNDAEACYWAGVSYERLADTRVPFGRRTYAKAHQYFSKAAKLEPARPEYREALFEFLLNTADCSRTALREATSTLSAMPKSDPGRYDMSLRLQEERRLSGLADARLARLFLLVPRATYDVGGLPGTVLAGRVASHRSGKDSNGRSRARSADSRTAVPANFGHSSAPPSSGRTRVIPFDFSAPKAPLGQLQN